MYYLFADKFGWTPDTVDKLDNKLVVTFSLVSQLIKAKDGSEMMKIIEDN